MAHIPNIAKILPALKTKRRADAAPLISRLADNLLVTTGRNACRASPSPNVFANFMVSKAEVNGLQVQVEPMQMTNITKTNDPRCVGGFNPSTLRKVITNSGPAAAALYMSFALNPWHFPDSFGTQHAAQTVFHCWFGTFREDLGVLASITELGHTRPNRRCIQENGLLSRNSTVAANPSEKIFKARSCKFDRPSLSGTEAIVFNAPVFRIQGPEAE